MLAIAVLSGIVRSFGFTVAITKTYDPQIDLLCFPTELKRAFINLLDNAFYAMEQKQQQIGETYSPALSVQTAKRGDRIEIRIRDNGTGIDTGHRHKILEPFFTTKPANQGTGLGLSMTHEIVVSQHGGTLTVETEPGAFAEFILTLPTALLRPEKMAM